MGQAADLAALCWQDADHQQRKCDPAHPTPPDAALPACGLAAALDSRLSFNDTQSPHLILWEAPIEAERLSAGRAGLVQGLRVRPHLQRACKGSAHVSQQGTEQLSRHWLCKSAAGISCVCCDRIAHAQLKGERSAEGHAS